MMQDCSMPRCAILQYSRFALCVCRQRLVRNWVRLWARFVLLLCGFYRVKVCGWHNYRAAEECR